jgi:chemotaxis protein methyltransferase CheR
MGQRGAHREGTLADLTAEEFRWIQEFLYSETGIVLNETKRPLVVGRLNKRLVHYGDTTFRAYFDRILAPAFVKERSIAIDLLTTNETYFFREPAHFEFLRQRILPSVSPADVLRVWSAASSSGEEAYTIAMVLAEHRDGPWRIIGTDISTRVVEKARTGLYPLAAREKIPASLLRKYCRRGRDEYEGFLLIAEELRRNIEFRHANLLEQLPDIGVFDVIFLRNVMIYFDLPTKKRLVARLQQMLKPGGYFFVSHSESLNGISEKLETIAPSIYRRGGR